MLHWLVGKAFLYSKGVWNVFGHHKYIWHPSEGTHSIHDVGSDGASYCEPKKRTWAWNFTPQKNTWHHNFLPKKMQDWNTSILIYYQHFFQNSHVAEKKFKWIILWSIDHNKNYAQRCVNPKKYAFILRPKKMPDWVLDLKKFWGCKFSTRQKMSDPPPLHPSCILWVPPWVWY